MAPAAKVSSGIEAAGSVFEPRGGQVTSVCPGPGFGAGPGAPFFRGWRLSAAGAEPVPVPSDASPPTPHAGWESTHAKKRREGSRAQRAPLRTRDQKTRVVAMHKTPRRRAVRPDVSP